MVRTFLACDYCRRSKLRCLSDINEKGEPQGKCQRCSKQSLNCVYTPKPSQMKKKVKLENKSNTKKSKSNGIVSSPEDVFINNDRRSISDSSPLSSTPTIQNTISLNNVDPLLKTNNYQYLGGIHNFNRQYRTRCPHQLDPIVLPNKTIIVQVLEEFFNNQYHTIFNFIHRENYINWIKSDVFGRHFFNYDDPDDVPDFTPCTLLAILAVCARHSKILTRSYGNFNQDFEPEKFIPNFAETNLFPITKDSPSNASKYFAYYSRLLLKDVFDTPSVQRVQSLALLSSHEWTEGNSARSYLYIGIAARMGSILGLCCKNGVCYLDEFKNGKSKRERFIALESKRRTIWAVFMMDRCNSSGRNRSHAIKIEDIGISLPCPEENFQNGIEIEFPIYNDCFQLLSNLTSLDFTIIAYELWSKIAKWVGETGAIKEKLSPNDPSSIFYKLSNDLQLLKESLPEILQFKNLSHQLTLDNLNFGYLHQLLNLCGIFLNREYFYYNRNISKKDHFKFTKDLIIDLQNSTNLIITLHQYNKFCITPFTSFQIFTNSVTCLSVSSILNDINLKQLGLTNMNYLKDKADQDQLASTWFIICQQLSKYLDSCKNLQEFNEKLKSSSKLNNLLNDYGESDISERLSINIPQKIKKIDLIDILNNNSPSPTNMSQNSSDSEIPISLQTSNSSPTSIDLSNNNNASGSYTTIPTNTSQQDYSLMNENDIDKYFKHWDKIIPNWNDVFIEDTSINAMNTYIE